MWSKDLLCVILILPECYRQKGTWKVTTTKGEDFNSWLFMEELWVGYSIFGQENWNVTFHSSDLQDKTSQASRQSKPHFTHITLLGIKTPRIWNLSWFFLKKELNWFKLFERGFGLELSILEFLNSCIYRKEVWSKSSFFLLIFSKRLFLKETNQSADNHMLFSDYFKVEKSTSTVPLSKN
jgi:hypothetical protein